MSRPKAHLLKDDKPIAFTYIYLNSPMIMLEQKFGKAWLERPETPIGVLMKRERRFLGAYYNCAGEPILVPSEYRQPVPVPFEFPGAEFAWHAIRHTIGGGWPVWGAGFHDNRILWMLKAGCCPKNIIAHIAGTEEVPT